MIDNIQHIKQLMSFMQKIDGPLKEMSTKYKTLLDSI